MAAPFTVENPQTGAPLATFDQAGNLLLAGQVFSGAAGSPAAGTVSGGTAAAVLSAAGQQQLLAARAAPLYNWYTSLAGRNYARCNVVVIGDSLTEGQGATVLDRRWIARLRDMLRSRFPTTGLAGGGRGFLPVQMTGESSYAYTGGTVTTITGGPATVNNLGPKQGGGAAVQLASAGQQVAWALNGTTAFIMWTQVAFGGTFSWKVDAGGTTNVSTNGGGTVDGKLTQVPLGSTGAHTLTAAWVSGSADIDGVIECNGDETSGIQVHDAGHYGWTSANWLADTTPTDWPSAIAALSPGVILIMLGTNDMATGITPAAHQANLTALTSVLRFALAPPYPPIVPVYLATRADALYASPWSAYVAAGYAAAAADPLGQMAVADLTLGPRMLAAPGTLWAADKVHPSDTGHSFTGDFLAQFLSPS